MSLSRAASNRASADSVLHPAFVRDRVVEVLDHERFIERTDDTELFNRLRSLSHAAAASVGPVHDGTKGQAVGHMKEAIQRGLYWYVDPPINALKATCLALIDTTESLAREVTMLRDEVAALRRDHESEHVARPRVIDHSATGAQ